MRQLFQQMMISLDGYYEGPGHEIDWHVVDEEFNEYADAMLESVDTLLFGRATYQLMADFWPTEYARQTDPVIARHMNRLQKIVFSKTLEKADWENTRLVCGDAVREIASLKSLPGGDMAIFGSSDLTTALIPSGLIDEFRIFVSPILLGRGKPLYLGLPARVPLTLTGTRAFQSGNVLLRYAPALQEPG